MISAKESESHLCHFKLHIDDPASPVISAIMFALGIFGNVAALVILEIRRRRDTRTGDTWRHSLFHVLITVLVVTDLAGTCLISPLVQLSYSTKTTLVGMSHSRNTTLVGMSHSRNTTLVGMSHSRNNTSETRLPGDSGSVCSYFGVSMTFFSLATMSLLFSMALERCFAIGYPYLYSRHVTRKCAYIAIPVVFLLCTLFCLLPFAGFGAYVQYCPGTWCFIDMNPKETWDRVYANLYASLMLVLVLAIVACNGFVVYQLFRMYQRRRRHGGSVVKARSNSERRAMSMAEEVEHLILLVFMTSIFIICTLPLVIRVYINSLQPNDNESHQLDLIALRFISVNSIIDPWVFILLSPSVLHFFWGWFCRAPLAISRGSIFKSSMAKENSPANIELSRPTLEYTEHFHTVET